MTIVSREQIFWVKKTENTISKFVGCSEISN